MVDTVIHNVAGCGGCSTVGNAGDTCRHYRCSTVCRVRITVSLDRTVVHKVLESRSCSLIRIYESRECSHCSTSCIGRVTLYIHRSVIHAVLHSRSHHDTREHTCIKGIGSVECELAGVTLRSTYGKVLHCRTVENTEKSIYAVLGCEVCSHLEVSDAVTLAVECTLECSALIC